jgi:hypothetical protein
LQRGLLRGRYVTLTPPVADIIIAELVIEAIISIDIVEEPESIGISIFGEN